MAKPKQKSAKKPARFPVLKFPPAPAAAAPAQPPAPFAQTSPQEIQQTIGQFVSRLPAPQTPQQIQQQVNQYRTSLPAPLSNQQIQQQAQGMLDPVIQRITREINQRAAGQAKAVEGYTNRLARNLSGIAGRVTQPYEQAQQQMAAADAALADRLSGGGGQAAQDLAARLASINAPAAVDPAVAQAQQAGAGAGNALYAGGNAALAELAANQAAAGAYGAKLPGIARLGGLQQAGLVRQQAASDLTSGLTDVEGQLPGIVQALRSMSEQRATNRATGAQTLLQNLTGNADTARDNRAQLAADLFGTLTGQNITKATAKAGLLGDAAAAAAPQIIGSGGTGYYEYDPTTGSSTQVVPAEPPPPVKPARPQIVGSDRAGRFAFNPETGQVTPLTKPVGGRAAGGLTANQAQRYKGVAETIAQQARSGFTDPKTGQEHPALDYQAALTEMRKAGVPDQIAVKALNRWYKVGSPGRPLPRDMREAAARLRALPR